MRLAVFADIHSNEQALASCLAYADHIGNDGYLFLGDHLTDCPYPTRTLKLLHDAALRKPTWCLRGNREDYLIAHHDNPNDGWKMSSETGSLLYTYQNLTPDDLEFLRAMPISQVISLPDCPPLRIAHAAPTTNTQLLYPGTEALESVMRASGQHVIVAGHSHFQFRYESGGRQFINPGTVGMSSGGRAKAQFAMLTCVGGRWSARLMNVDYDVDAELRQFAESGLDDMARVWAKAVRKTLKEGGAWCIDCLQLARKLATGEKEINESHWEEAAMRLGLM